MLNEFIREQDEKQAQLKQQRINIEKAKTTKTASIQCDRWDVLQKSDVAVQTEFPDVMDDLKEQIRQLTKIVADLTALKNRHQGNVPNNQLNDEDILMDSLSDVLPFDAELSSNQPVPETPPEGPAQAPSMTQSVPLAVVNSGAMLQPPSSNHLCDHRYPPLIRTPHLCSEDTVVTAPQMITGKRLNW